jgi:hypothetical protein
MEHEIIVTLEATEPAPRFRFALANGSEPRLTSIMVRGEAETEPLWWLMAGDFVHVPSAGFEIVEPSEAEIEGMAASAGLDPLEDLPPDDPRHQAALRARDELVESTQIPLRTLSYGTVPSGFRQGMPASGPAPELVRGGRYTIHVCGRGLSDYGSLEFESP